MLRVVAYITMLWYTVLAFGLSVHLHYCCGKLADVGFNVVNHGGCEAEHSGCSEHQDECSFSQACCTFSDLYLGIDADHLPQFFAFSFLKTDLPFVAVYQEVIVSTPVLKPQSLVANSGPPEYIKYKQLITYG